MIADVVNDQKKTKANWGTFLNRFNELMIFLDRRDRNGMSSEIVYNTLIEDFGTHLDLRKYLNQLTDDEFKEFLQDIENSQLYDLV